MPFMRPVLSAPPACLYALLQPLSGLSLDIAGLPSQLGRFRALLSPTSLLHWRGLDCRCHFGARRFHPLRHHKGLRCFERLEYQPFWVLLKVLSPFYLFLCSICASTCALISSASQPIRCSLT